LKPFKDHRQLRVSASVTAMDFEIATPAIQMKRRIDAASTCRRGGGYAECRGGDQDDRHHASRSAMHGMK
jgi:hypothetical protein